MQCPICGETLPLSSKVCASCGNEYDGFFLTEEVESSAARRSVTQQKPPRQPSALKPRRAPIDGRRMAMIGGGVAAVLVIAVAAFLFIPRGKGGAGKPADAVTNYYKYLQSGDSEGLLALFDSAFQPVESEKTGLKAAIAANSYAVTGPTIRVISDDDTTAYVAIDSVGVAVTPRNGAPPQRFSLASLISQLPDKDPQQVSVVKHKHRERVEGRRSDIRRLVSAGPLAHRRSKKALEEDVVRFLL